MSLRRTAICGSFLLLVKLLMWQFASAADIAQTSKLSAVECLEKFTQRYSQIQEYEFKIFKKEWDIDGNLAQEEIMLAHITRPNRVSLTYLNEGSTGVRNNGMKIDYFEGSDHVKIHLGKPTPLGFLVHQAASLKVGNGLPVYDSEVLNGELLTINRAGFDFLARMIEQRLHKKDPQINEKLKLLDSTQCWVKYKPIDESEINLEVPKDTHISSLEEKYATLAFIIYYKNKDLFSSFHDLFVRKDKMSLRIPTNLVPFELKLNMSTFLPEEFVVFFQDKKMGQYQFKDFTALKETKK